MGLDNWWEAVDDDVPRVLLADRNRVLLPARTVKAYAATGGPALVEIDGRPGRWRWPAEVRALLLDQWAQTRTADSCHVTTASEQQ